MKLLGILLKLYPQEFFISWGSLHSVSSYLSLAIKCSYQFLAAFDPGKLWFSIFTHLSSFKVFSLPCVFSSLMTLIRVAHFHFGQLFSCSKDETNDFQVFTYQTGSWKVCGHVLITKYELIKIRNNLISRMSFIGFQFEMHKLKKKLNVFFNEQ